MDEKDNSWEWACGLMALLDEIERVAGDRKKVLQLTQSRFDLARQNGFDVKFGSESTDALQ
jgi:uncharacterized protein (UPF0335 family)